MDLTDRLHLIIHSSNCIFNFNIPVCVCYVLQTAFLLLSWLRGRLRCSESSPRSTCRCRNSGQRVSPIAHPPSSFIMPRLSLTYRCSDDCITRVGDLSNPPKEALRALYVDRSFYCRQVDASRLAHSLNLLFPLCRSTATCLCPYTLIG
jgi:hypothetical protein